MESSSPLGEASSPESTATSSSWSSGQSSSSVQPPEHTFRYREQDYDSASAASDAYIADFERSCRKCGSPSGPSVSPRSQPSTPRKPRVGALRNRDVLRERSTDRESDFSNLPVSSLHHRQNRQRVSMTTDESSAIPHDGSMPVTHTSAFIRGLSSRSAASEPFPSSTGPTHGSGAGLSSSSYASRRLFGSDPNQNHLPTRTARSGGEAARDRCGPAVDTSPVDTSPVDTSSWTNTAADSLLPHWSTSNKAHMDGSEISSSPDSKYPAWIRRCRSGRPESWDERGAARVRAPSWVSDSEEDEESQQVPAQVDAERTSRDSRLQSARQLSVLAAGGRGSERSPPSFTEHRMESSIQKADQVSDASNSGGAESSAGKAGGVGAEDPPPSSRPRRPSVSQDSGAAESEADWTQRDEEGRGFHGNATRKQPGPAEAVKQMSFRLQAVEAELQRRRADARDPRTAQKQEADGEAEPQSFPGSPSSQRASHHSKRSKESSEEPGQRGRGTEEDEGRPSSGSQQEAS